MDEIEKRLRDTSEHCYNCYDTWQKNKKDSKAREDLNEAVHELRKVASRLEIELAVSERDEMASKPIPIPPHRASKRRGKNQDNEADEGNDAPQAGNSDPGANKPKVERKGRRRPEGGDKKAASGGDS